MKLNKYLLMAAMGLGLVACTENDLVEGGDSNGAQNEGTTYVGFTIDFSKTQTKATETETGTAAEQKINKAYVIMADADGNVEQIVSTANKGTGDSNKETDYYVIQTNPGLHYFYAVVNPDQTDGNDNVPTVGGTISSYFNTAVPLDVAKIASVTDASFMMASHEVLTANVEDGVTENEALKGTKNCFTIKVERATAKVTMTCEKATLENAVGIPNEPEYGGTVSDLKFNLKGVANMAYRMAQSEWNNITDNSWKPKEDGTVNNNTLGVQVAIGQDYTAVNAAYCLENMDSPYKQGNTTYLTLQTTFTPAKVVDCADVVKPLTTNTQAAGSTFYVVKQGELAGNYLMEADLQDYRDEKGDQSALPAGVEAISDAYTGGNCYFGPIWIGQEDADDADAPIYRNTWYNLEITGITLPGDPEEPTIDYPEQPLTSKTNVAITLSVMPWNFINREISLQ